MDNVTFIEVTDPMTNEVVEYAIIDRGNGKFTSMLKSTYDAQQAALATLVTESAPTAQ
jgi:hypothetical protein